MGQNFISYIEYIIVVNYAYNCYKSLKQLLPSRQMLLTAKNLNFKMLLMIISLKTSKYKGTSGINFNNDIINILINNDKKLAFN